MRKSTSPFSTWKPSKATRRLLFATTTFSASLAVILGSCRVRDEEAAATLAPVTAEAATDVGFSVATADAASAPQPEKPRTNGSCSAEVLAKLPWRAVVKTPAGDFPVQLDLKDAASLQAIAVRVGDETLQLPAKDLLTPSDLQALCSAIPPTAIGDEAVALVGSSPFARALMARVAPNCAFRETVTDAWECEWRARTVAASGDDLDRLETRILTRWSRHPYALVRRLTLARQLQHALSRKDGAARLADFCKVTSQSLPIELPLVVRSEAWQKHVCQGGEGGPDVDMARAALSMAVDEVIFLANSYEKQSHQGVIAVQVPTPPDVRVKNFWVSLQQVPAQAEPAAPKTSLLKEAEAKAASPETAEAPVHACWSPFFPWRSELTAMALESGVLSLDPTGNCQRKDALGASDRAKAKAYFEASITSESEFIVGNGRAKIIQLPAGEYAYTVRPHRSLFDTARADAPNDLAKGQLSWDTKTRRTVIK